MRHLLPLMMLLLSLKFIKHLENDIGIEGANIIGKALQTNVSLIQLDLSGKK